MTGHVRRLTSENQRDIACRIIRAAPLGSVVRVTPPGRSLDQNAKMHAMLSDVSMAKPRGLFRSPMQWKCVAMQGCGFETETLNDWYTGIPFATGHSTSKLSKEQFSVLIEWLYRMGAEEGITWSEPEQ
jgi:hypothetical protein